jgi:LPS-assembly lipoprotein
MTKRSALLLILPLLAAPLLSGCGFTPLYAERGVGPALSSVDVVSPKGRVGYLMQEQLDDALARSRGEKARYRLTMNTNEVRTPRGLRLDNTATEYELNLTVAYTLVETATGRTLRSGVAPVTVIYQSSDAPYAGISAQNDAQERAVTQAATLVRLDLSRYFAGEAAKAAPR